MIYSVPLITNRTTEGASTGIEIAPDSAQGVLLQQITAAVAAPGSEIISILDPYGMCDRHVLDAVAAQVQEPFVPVRVDFAEARSSANLREMFEAHLFVEMVARNRESVVSIEALRSYVQEACNRHGLSELVPLEAFDNMTNLARFWIMYAQSANINPFFDLENIIYGTNPDASVATAIEKRRLWDHVDKLGSEEIAFILGLDALYRTYCDINGIEPVSLLRHLGDMLTIFEYDPKNENPFNYVSQAFSRVLCFSTKQIAAPSSAKLPVLFLNFPRWMNGHAVATSTKLLAQSILPKVIYAAETPPETANYRNGAKSRVLGFYGNTSGGLRTINAPTPSTYDVLRHLDGVTGDDIFYGISRDKRILMAAVNGQREDGRWLYQISAPGKHLFEVVLLSSGDFRLAEILTATALEQGFTRETYISAVETYLTRELRGIDEPTRDLLALLSTMTSIEGAKLRSTISLDAATSLLTTDGSVLDGLGLDHENFSRNDLYAFLRSTSLVRQGLIYWDPQINCWSVPDTIRIALKSLAMLTNPGPYCDRLIQLRYIYNQYAETYPEKEQHYRRLARHIDEEFQLTLYDIRHRDIFE